MGPTVKGFECYKTFMGLRKHFTSTYDYGKYQGKMKVSPNTYKTRPDYFFFEKLAKRNDMFSYMLANISLKPNIWIDELVNSPECEDVFLEWQKRTQALTYTVKEQLTALAARFTFNELLTIDPGSLPRLIGAFRRDEITIEGLLIIDSLFKDPSLFEMWDKQLQENVFWRKVYTYMQKYATFYKPTTRETKIIREHIKKVFVP